MIQGPRRALDIAAALLRVGFADAMAYRGEFVVWFLSTNTALIMLALWTSVAAEAPVGRFGERQFVAYFLVTLVVRLLSGAWVVWEMNMDIRSGALGMRLLRPLHPFLHYAGENIAAWPLRLATATPVIVVVFWVVGISGLSHDWRQLALFPLTLAGAWSLTFCAMAAVGTLSFFWQSSMNVFHLWMLLYFVFSGYIVPIELFPTALREIVAYLPFRYIIALPVETALGFIDLRTSLVYFGRQSAYIAGFAALAMYLWRTGVRRYEVFGG